MSAWRESLSPCRSNAVCLIGCRVPNGPVPETTVFVGQVPKTAVFIGPVPETSVFIGPVPEAAGFIGQVPETAVFNGPVPESAVFIDPVPKTVLVTGPAPDTAVFNGPASETAVFIGSAPETAVFVGPAPETAVLVDRHHLVLTGQQHLIQFLCLLNLRHLRLLCSFDRRCSCVHYTGNILLLTVRIITGLAPFDSCVQWLYRQHLIPAFSGPATSCSWLFLWLFDYIAASESCVQWLDWLTGCRCVLGLTKEPDLKVRFSPPTHFHFSPPFTDKAVISAAQGRCDEAA